MAQVGRISGPLLTENLLRNGNNLAFRNDLDTTQLLYLDVVEGRLAVNHNAPNYELDVAGTLQTTNLKALTAITAGLTFTNSTISAIGNIDLNAAEAIVLGTLENGTIRINDNIISTMTSNANIDLTPSTHNISELMRTLDNPNAYGTTTNDRFGQSAAISGNLAIVGAYGEDDAGGTGSGKAYIFNVTSGVLLRTLVNPNFYDTSAGDYFGYSVAMSGNYAIVGAPKEDHPPSGPYNRDDKGYAYIFNVTTGALLHTITGSGASGAIFGWSVAISGNNLIVGEPNGYAGPNQGAAGVAYIFNVTTGTLVHRITNPRQWSQDDGSPSGDEFGFDVAISGNLAIVGAHDSIGNDDNGSGICYVYDVTTGALVRMLDNPDADNDDYGDHFGYSVDIDGTTAIVGAYNEDETTYPGSGSGKAYIFNVTSGALLHTIANPTAYGSPAQDSFGWSVAISGNYATVSAPREDDGPNYPADKSSGKAYIFNVTTGALLGTLDNPNPIGTSRNDFFGYGLAISGNNLIVGAPWEDDSSSQYATSGKAYIYKIENTTETNSINVFGDIHTPGNITFDGTITLGDSDQDSVDFNSDISSDIIPNVRNTYNLGNADKKWSDLYTNLVNGQAASANELLVNGVNGLFTPGGTLYVAVTGNDNAKGDHILDPFATIARALQAAESSGEQPVTVHVSAGEYQESLPLVVPNNVTITGRDIRNTIITPDTSSQSEDVFHLNDNTTITNLTIQNHFYDSGNNTGYAFRFAPNAVMSTRSPYIQNVTVLTQETSSGAGDSGRGAYIDGDELNAATVNKTMLFHSCTFISPGADVINMTNDVRVEWLNSFTYFANRGLYAFNGSSGGAELRSIGSANVYGTYGAVADGADTLMYLIQHNFAYIGAGNNATNNNSLTIQANEVVELNSGQVQYVTTDQSGAFRIGDLFYVDFETGNTSLNISSGSVNSTEGLIINSGGSQSVISSTKIETANIRFTQNLIDSLSGELNIAGGTGTINLQDNSTVSGNVSIRDNFSFGGSLTLAGDQTLEDRITFNVEFEQDFVPHTNSQFDLGENQRYWLNVYLRRLEAGDIVVDDNFITTSASNANLELRANGTGNIYVPSNSVQINNALTANGTSNFQVTSIDGSITHTGDTSQIGNYTLTNLTLTDVLDVTGAAQFEEILIDDNFITTTTSNASLELRANGTGKILVPENNVRMINNVSVNNIVNNNNITVSLQTEFNEALVNDITITENYITTNNTNANLELRANGTGKVVSDSNTVINNVLTTVGTTTLKNSIFSYEYGSELVTNGTFNSNLTGWSQSGAGTATATAGNLRINATGAARNVAQEITVVAGKTYDFTATFRSVSNANAFYLRIFESGVGTLFEWNESSGLSIDQVLTASFVPVGTEIDIIFRSVDTVVEWDNVSLIEDIGLVEYITPMQTNIIGTTNQTGNVNQTGNLVIAGELTVSNEVTSSHINIDANAIKNYREDLRLTTDNTNVNLSLSKMIYAMANGDTVDDYAGQTEKNLITLLANGTSAPDYALSYADVNRDSNTTTSDALAWLQYIANGSTGDATKDTFIKNIVELLLEDEFANPGKYNSIIFSGDYYRADLALSANGTGRVTMPGADVRVANNLFAASINAADIIINQNLALDELIITDSIIEIDDNFISTTISNADLDLRATRNVVLPVNDVIFNQELTVNTNTNISNVNITGNTQQTGNRNQIGNLAVVGTVTVTTSNIKSEIQFDDIIFNDNYIETTNSNANLELLANGTGKIIIPSNNVQINNNISLGSLNSSLIGVENALAAQVFDLSSNIKIFDNVITTTTSNSNLELRSFNASVKIESLLVNNDTISSTGVDINFNPTNNLNINATGAVKLPSGSTVNRQVTSNNIRFNSTDNVFEAFNNSNTLSFNGVYSANRNASVLAHPTDNTIALTAALTQVGTVNATGLVIHGLDVDDLTLQTNNIGTTVSNSNVDLKAHGTGNLRIDQIDLSDNKFINNTGANIVLSNTGFGKIKFIDTNAVRFPAGTSAERVSGGEATGLMRWNTEIEVLETWDGNTYISAAGNAATISAAEMDDLILEYTLIFG